MKVLGSRCWGALSDPKGTWRARERDQENLRRPNLRRSGTDGTAAVGQNRAALPASRRTTGTIGNDADAPKRNGRHSPNDDRSCRKTEQHTRAAQGTDDSDSQPCRCLWRGSSHTTKTTPRRRTILHLSQMRRTLARTFIRASWRRPPTPSAGSGKSDGKSLTIETTPPGPQGEGFKMRELAGKNRKKPPAAAAGPGGAAQEGAVSPGSGALVRTSGPFSVIAIVCSKWALARPSTVDCVQ